MPQQNTQESNNSHSWWSTAIVFSVAATIVVVAPVVAMSLATYSAPIPASYLPGVAHEVLALNAQGAAYNAAYSKSATLAAALVASDFSYKAADLAVGCVKKAGNLAYTSVTSVFGNRATV